VFRVPSTESKVKPQIFFAVFSSTLKSIDFASAEAEISDF
jgi:hypothetical protein